MNYKNINNIRREAMYLPYNVVGEMLIEKEKFVTWEDMYFLDDYLDNYYDEDKENLTLINLDDNDKDFSYDAGWFLVMDDGATLGSFDDIDTLFEDYFSEVIEESTPLELMKLLTYGNQFLTHPREDLQAMYDFAIAIMEEIREEEE